MAFIAFIFAFDAYDLARLTGSVSKDSTAAPAVWSGDLGNSSENKEPTACSDLQENPISNESESDEEDTDKDINSSILDENDS